MKKVALCLFAFVYFSLFETMLLAQTNNPYCNEFVDEYRQIRYWAKSHIFVVDFNYGSGDAAYLNLTYKDIDKSVSDRTSKSIVDHFNAEFKRLIKGNLPFYNTDEGYKTCFSEFYKKFKNDNDIHEKFRAYEASRRRALYGNNPGAFFCAIRVSRRDFPILYEIDCNIATDEELRNIPGWKQAKLGFSTPELIG